MRESPEMKALRERMAERLAQHMVEIQVAQPKGHRWLAAEIGERYQQIWRWLGGETQMPAHFILAYLDAVPTNPRWLLTGEGSPEAGREDAERTLDAIREILNGRR